MRTNHFITSYLIDTVLINSFLLIQAGESSIMALIQSPGLSDRNEQLVGLLKGEEQSFNGALQTGSVSSIELEALSLDELTTVSGLFHSLIRERNIIPSGEAILLVPLGFSMTDKNQSVEGLSSSCYTSGSHRGGRHEEFGGGKHERNDYLAKKRSGDACGGSGVFTAVILICFCRGIMKNRSLPACYECKHLIIGSREE